MSKPLCTAAHCLIYRLRKKGIRVNTKERVIFLPYGEKISDYVQIERLHKEFYLNVQYIIT
ncbi:hypothetical protein IMSAGC006_01051 [Muribaculaceae bacterium]|uniref:hypothetical protein n=1 Tax=uncultured Bacteroides sp. TaxID=162156 RepID=UPI00143482BB|nr:hypothetical protein [uncultured Bacteroides sp.]GFI06308.1 hypothetical protein IMSAGC006_01051 [Muribaculaceae bacterium]